MNTQSTSPYGEEISLTFDRFFRPKRYRSRLRCRILGQVEDELRESELCFRLIQSALMHKLDGPQNRNKRSRFVSGVEHLRKGLNKLSAGLDLC